MFIDEHEQHTCRDGDAEREHSPLEAMVGTGKPNQTMDA